MQLKLALTAARSSCVSAAAQLNKSFQWKLFAAAASTTGRTADPAIHSGEVEAGPDVHTAEPHGGESATDAESVDNPQTSQRNLGKDTNMDPLVPPKPPTVSSPRLETTGLKQPVNPNFQQKRENSNTAVAPEEVICVGFDGTPLSKDRENEQRDKREKVQDDKDYFADHKASPLSEIEIADTRKPITRATDGTADAGSDYGGGRTVIGWLPEQLDTAEDSLRRATEMFKERAMRGDSDVFPHSRILRELRDKLFRCAINFRFWQRLRGREAIGITEY